jgi:hypothetical protein
VYFFPSFLFFPLHVFHSLAFVSALMIQDGSFLRAQRYPDEYEEDSSMLPTHFEPQNSGWGTGGCGTDSATGSWGHDPATVSWYDWLGDT